MRNPFAKKNSKGYTQKDINEIEVARDILMQFHDLYNLPLNPENYDDMAFAVVILSRKFKKRSDTFEYYNNLEQQFSNLFKGEQ